MPTIEPRAIPDDHYSFHDIDTLITAIERRLEARQAMRTQDAARFLGISASKLYRLDNIPSHRVPGLNGKLYLRSEIIDYIKRH